MALAEIGLRRPETAPESGANHAVVSAVAELFWGVRLLQRDWESVPEHLSIDATRARRLATRIREFWADGLGCFTELFVLAGRGGHLDDETLDPFFDDLTSLCRAPLERRMLTTEDAADRSRTIARLNELHDDSRTRSAYHRLLESVWEMQEPAWRSGGRAAVRHEAAAWQAQVKRGVPLPTAAFASSCGDVAGMAGEAAAQGRLLAAPTFFGTGFCIVDAGPRTILSSPGERGADGSQRVRAAARAAAARYKALADPSRMAILALCQEQPLTIGEVAKRLDLSQPTVSAHFTALRGAGLVREVDGTRPVRYRLDSGRLDGILGEVRSLVLNEAL
ncbi:MAG: winged helix-turn-helix transcriptional regulator [Candidatus Dormibacteraeota bacterium]|nr:winged helix-turn-helix transcriptional regulator [Candidatus Dormibacteraeota bacterium]